MYSYSYSYVCAYIYIQVGNRCRGRPEGLLFNSYYTEYKGGRYSLPWIAPPTLDPYLIMLS